MLEQFDHRLAIARIQAHADADSGYQRAPVDHHRRAQQLIDARGSGLHLINAGDFLEHHDELVTAHAHHHVVGAHRPANASGDLLQQFVADLVTT